MNQQTPSIRKTGVNLNATEMYPKKCSRQEYLKMTRLTMGTDSNTQALLMKFQHLYLMNVLIQLQQRCNKWYARVKQKLSLLINKRMHLHRYWSIKKNDSQTDPQRHHNNIHTENTPVSHLNENFMSGLNQMLLASKVGDVSIPMQVLLLPLIVPSGANNQSLSSSTSSSPSNQQVNHVQMKIANSTQAYLSQPTRISLDPLPGGNNWTNIPLNNPCSQIQFNPKTDGTYPSSWSGLQANPNMVNSVQNRNPIY